MDNEQEGIELETVNSGQNTDSIILPDVEDVETNETIEDNKIDEEKESLKRGVNKERTLRKEAEKKNKELEARIQALEEANKTPQKTTEEELVEVGVDANVAKTIAKTIDKKQAGNKELEKQLAEVKFENALTKKSKEEGFEDILDYADEVKDLVDKGLTIEQSYYAVSYDKPKTSKNTKSEIERKVEAKMQNNQARKEILGNYNNNSTAVQNSNNNVNISAEEKAVAAMAGMTAEEYISIRDAKNVKDYEKYNSRKVK